MEIQWIAVRSRFDQFQEVMKDAASRTADMAGRLGLDCLFAHTLAKLPPTRA